MKMWTDRLECDGDCGEVIEVTSHMKGEVTMAAAEALGWSTVDTKRNAQKMEVYCPFCQERARRIVKTIGVN